MRPLIIGENRQKKDSVLRQARDTTDRGPNDSRASFKDREPYAEVMGVRSKLWSLLVGGIFFLTGGATVAAVAIVVYTTIAAYMSGGDDFEPVFAGIPSSTEPLARGRAEERLAAGRARGTGSPTNRYEARLRR